MPSLASRAMPLCSTVCMIRRAKTPDALIVMDVEEVASAVQRLWRLLPTEEEPGEEQTIER